MQFGFISERETIDAVFILRSLQEGFPSKGKMLYMCFEDLEKTFDKVPRKVFEFAMRKKGIVLVRSVMSVYEGAKTRVIVDFELSDKFDVKVGMHRGSVLPPFYLLPFW